jgi:hypothetical protein
MGYHIDSAFGDFMNSNNVIAFPRAYSGPAKEEIKISQESITRNLDMMKQFHMQETLTNVIPMIFNQLDISGFAIEDIDPSDDESLKDGALIVEAIRSYMCKYYGIYHPFQKLAETVFESDGEEPETLNIVDTLNVKLKEEDISL